MDRIYNDACDKNVAAIIVYLNAEDEKLYYDAEFTEAMEVPEADLKNLFIKGALVDNGDGLFAATGYTEDDGIIWAIPEAEGGEG